MLPGCLNNTADQPKSEMPDPDISKNGDATAEKPLSEIPSTETQLNHFNTYSRIIKCVNNLGSNDKDAKKKFNENLSQLEKELSPIVEHAKQISLTLMIVNGTVPKKCLSDKLSQ